VPMSMSMTASAPSVPWELVPAQWPPTARTFLHRRVKRWRGMASITNSWVYVQVRPSLLLTGTVHNAPPENAMGS